MNDYLCIHELIYLRCLIYYFFPTFVFFFVHMCIIS